MSTVNSPGSSRTVSLPCGSRSEPLDVEDAASLDPEEQAARLAAATRAAASTRAPARRSAAGPMAGLTVGHGLHDGEVVVQLDVDLAGVVPGHLDLVVAVLVPDLRAGDPATAGLGEGGIRGLTRRIAGDGRIGVVGGCGRSSRAAEHDRGRAGHHDDLSVDLLHEVPPGARVFPLAQPASPGKLTAA